MLSTAVTDSITDNIDLRRKAILKDIVLEFISLHGLGDELTLVVIRGDSRDDVCLTPVSLMKWRATEIIECYHNSGDIMLVAHSKERGDEALLTLTSDELYARTYGEEDAEASYLFRPVRVESNLKIKMSCTIGSTLILNEENEATKKQEIKGQTAPNNDAKSRRDCFQETGDIECLTSFISILSWVILMATRALNITIVMGKMLVGSYFQRRDSSGNLDDIEKSIAHHQQIMDLTPAGHVDLPARLNDLGICYGNQFKRTRNLEDIERAVSFLQKAVDLTPSGDAGLHARLQNLGNSYIHRFRRTGNVEDIEHSIAFLQKAADLTPSDHADLPERFRSLGISYRDRFKRTGNLDDIKHSISFLQKAVDLTPVGHVDLPARLNDLGISYGNQFRCTRNLESIEHAISFLQKAVDLTPSDDAGLHVRLQNLGNSYIHRFRRTGNLEDIENSISFLQISVDLIPSGHADLPARFQSLGISYRGRFWHNGNLEDIEHAISLLQKSVDLTPSGHTDLAARFHSLGGSYRGQFRHNGKLEDIEHSISFLQKAVDLTPSGHIDLPARFQSLGNSYCYRFSHSGNIEDIEHAISFLQKAVDLTPCDTDLPARLHSLGSSYRDRFSHNGNLEDIEHSISFLQKAVDLTTSGHADLPARFQSLGNSYCYRFSHNENLEDIDHSILFLQKAVDLTPSGHADLPARFHSLGSSYCDRFWYSGNIKDIAHSISFLQKAVDLTPSGHADLPARFQSLGILCRDQFKRTGDLKDIKHSISFLQKAVDLTPSGHARLPAIFHGLGQSYNGRFRRDRNLEDIKNSISYHRKAVDLTPSGHADLPAMFNSLGNSYRDCYVLYNDCVYIQNCIISYRCGAQSEGNPSTRLICAKNAANQSSVHDVSQCLVDFALAISLLAEIAGLELTIHRRFDNLHEHSDIVSSAVLTAFSLNSPHLAIEWLEQGRCLVWNQLNQLRSPIDDLRNHYPSLAGQFVSVATALESYGSRSRLPITLDATMAHEMRLQNDTQSHTHHAAQWKKLLANIRALPNFHSFLLPPQMNDIRSALPNNGSVVVFNLHKLRCDALVLIYGIEEPLHIPLIDFSLGKATELLKTLRFDILKHREVKDQDQRIPYRVKSKPSSMSYVLKELWCNVVQPVIKALGYSSDYSQRPRIWWCPTGPLAFLPLHAAGIYGQECSPGFCVSDYAVSSYTPSVQSLNEKYSASCRPGKSTSILLINPNTPNLSPIPFTGIETRALKEMFGDSALLLEDAEATTIEVKSEFSTHSWVHFACHGIQDTVDPLKSGVHLYDGRLELLDIMRMKLANSELAFLSACQTGKGDLKLSDEVVHLAAGMLAAGFHGAVATMWSISDLHGPEFAKHFYEYLIQGKGSDELDSRQAAYALDHATRKVRETLGEGDAAFLTWVPYVHYGY